MVCGNFRRRLRKVVANESHRNLESHRLQCGPQGHEPADDHSQAYHDFNNYLENTDLIDKWRDGLRLGSSFAIGGLATKTAGKLAAMETGGRLGSFSTRTQVADIQAELKARGWTVTRGGKLGEEYIPGAGGARKGSAYPDITATKNGRTLRINTIDTLLDGKTPTAREAANAAKIRALTPGDHLLLVPKR